MSCLNCNDGCPACAGHIADLERKLERHCKANVELEKRNKKLESVLQEFINWGYSNAWNQRVKAALDKLKAGEL